MIIHNDIEQNSAEWMQLRAGMPTASSFSKLVSGTGKPSDSMIKYARALARELYTGQPSSEFGSNYHTRRGHELEPLAAAEYAFKNDVDPQIVGFVTTDERLIGSSPDRLINDDGVLEIKCLSDEQHHDLLDYYKANNDIQPKYKPQLQGEMLVCERVWNDIYFYHPSLPSITLRFRPDEIYLKKLNKQISVCLKERQKALDGLRAFNPTPVANDPVMANSSKLSIEV